MNCTVADKTDEMSLRNNSRPAHNCMLCITLFLYIADNKVIVNRN